MAKTSRSISQVFPKGSPKRPTAAQLKLYAKLTAPRKRSREPGLEKRYDQLREEHRILQLQHQSALAQLNRRANIAQLLKAHEAALDALDLGVERVHAALSALYVGKEKGK